MASETEAPEISSLFERLLRHRDLYFFLPFILGVTNNSVSRENSENPDQETSQETTSQRERIILVNPFTQGMVVVEGDPNLEALLRGWANKDGQPPASKASIEAMPSVKIGESEDGECVVCLEEWKPGEVVKEMPCKHKYKMPVDEEDMGKKRDEERSTREIWVSLSFDSSRRTGDSNQVPSTDNEMEG
ncbi:E3 ubiquitin-protein ligase RING1-like [Gossypium australe]|uniref:RING-type E3 ubiquitin transferase n=1 Tax=Gossypium australe TaxID=47621 RepID=A0A5B6X300_9ROSI|nr:E3 ubiquitin-protein ligase RING1-like [Gossypium australe]